MKRTTLWIVAAALLGNVGCSVIFPDGTYLCYTQPRKYWSNKTIRFEVDQYWSELPCPATPIE